MNTLLSYFLLLFFTPLLMIYAIYGINKSPTKWRKFLPLLIIGVGLISYNFPPKIEGDLTRYFTMAEECGRLSFKDSFSYFGKTDNFDSGLWAIIFIFWVVGKIDVVHLLPMLTGALVYGIAFYITCDTAERYAACNIIPRVLFFQICMLPYFNIIANVRNISAFALVVLATYLDTVKNKHNIVVLALYIIPCFMHTSAVVLILLRLSMALSTKIKVPFLLLIFSLPLLIDTLYENIGRLSIGGSIGSILTNMSLKAYWYLHDKDSTEWARQVSRSQYYKLNRIIMVALALVIIGLICFGILKYTKSTDRKFSNYLFLVSIMTVACSWFTTPHYWRFSAVSMTAIGAILIPIYKTKSLNKYSLDLLKHTLWLFPAFGLLFQIWQGRYNVDLFEWVGNILLNNMYVVLFEIIKGVFLA